MKWSKGKIFGAVWITLGVCFFIWMFVSMSAQGVDEQVFVDSSTVHVKKNDDYISFTPTEPYQKVVFFYPGALVDPDAYAPLCRKISESGYQVLLIHMPWRMATKGYTKIKEINLIADTAKQYILAGHSQGGKMAAQFVYENPNLIDKLILLGTTHPRDINLSTLQIPVVKIYGSNDGVAEPDKVTANKSKLPFTTKYVRIGGANHSQFGYYGFQLGDNEAEITRQEQQQQVLVHILFFIKSDSTAESNENIN
jgi:hypothetical protein